MQRNLGGNIANEGYQLCRFIGSNLLGRTRTVAIRRISVVKLAR